MNKNNINSPFRSFWMAGFEGAHHKLCHGERLDMRAVNQHDVQVKQDFYRIREMGLCTARESLPWDQIDRGASYDFSPLASITSAAKNAEIQIIWSLCHYGWPDDLDVFSPAFIDRFARYCRQVASFVAGESDEIPLYNPINEISFLAWAAAEAGFMYPCVHGRANEFKQQMVRATIAGCEAIWEVDPRARMFHTDPVIQVIAPPDRPDLARHAFIQQNAQFEAWDSIGGWDHPEWGGHPRYLDIIAANYYHNNQWELERPHMSWEDRLASGDQRWLPFHKQLESVYSRYLRPIMIGETGHFGAGRGPWLRRIATEVHQAIKNGVPLEGICLYPVIDRPDWHDPHHWHASGLWDVALDEDGVLQRVLNQPYVEDLQWAQKYLPGFGVPSTST